jgi:hypothetical protein
MQENQKVIKLTDKNIFPGRSLNQGRTNGGFGTKTKLSNSIKQVLS